MNIFIIGASGMIGSRLVAEAASRGHHVIAAARNADKIEARDGVEPVALDIHDVPAASAYAERADVVVSAVSPRNSGDADADAQAFTRSLIALQRSAGKRIVVVGGAGTLQYADGSPVAPTIPEPYRDEAKAMRRAYGLLVSEDVDFTFLAPPGMIAPGARTGKFRIGGSVLLADETETSHISAEDYAVALLDEVESPKHFRTVFTVGY